MIRFLFFLRFRSQLRRTNPRMVDALEGRVLELMAEAGGLERIERRMVGAVFSETSLGFGLDILSCIEGIGDSVESCAGQLFGHALVIGKDIPDDAGEPLCRYFSSPRKAGIYCDGKLRELLGNYLLFDESAESPIPEAGSFARVSAGNPLEGLGAPASLEAERARREGIVKSLSRGNRKNTLVTGPEFFGKRGGIYEFISGPFLAVRFSAGASGTAGRGLAALSDAYSPALRSFLGEGLPESAAPENRPPPGRDPRGDLDLLQETIFQDRLHGELSPLLFRAGRRFFKLLLDAYTRVSQDRGIPAVLILEDVGKAPEGAARIVQEVLSAYFVKEPLLPRLEVYGTASGDLPPGSSWGRFFPRIIRLEGEGGGAGPDMSGDLWELCYAFALLGRYFPGPLLTRILAESGKSPRMISRALDMLIRCGVIDTREDPRPRIRRFLPQAEAVLGERKFLVRSMVQNRLLDWVFSRRFHPCFALLDALAGLLEGPAVFETIKRGDELILKSLLTDLSKGHSAGFEQAIKEGRMESIVGPQRALTVGCLVRGSKALVDGKTGEINEAFRSVPSEDRIYPPFRAQVLVNSAAYFLGVRDIDSAQKAVKDAFVLSQEAPWSGLAQCNRLLSLVNLFKQRMGETVEYAAFAVENAEKSGSYGELALASYYGATVQALYGNIFLAEQLAEAAETQAAQAGRVEWIDRSRFFRGKLAFDMGRYQDALRFFQDIAENPSGNPSPEKLSLMEAWAYRARIYSQNPLLPGPAGNIDADLFTIEGTYLSGDYGRTAELASALAESLPGDSFIFTEQPDWHSGFAQCELLLIPTREFWGRMVLVYRALALCRLSPEGGAEALKIMQRVLRDERLSETDPWDAFYYYAWYQVLEKSGAPQVDMNTAISMAFKQLQRRASRIGDIKARQAYLSQPRWNGALSLAAKEHRLI